MIVVISWFSGGMLTKTAVADNAATIKQVQQTLASLGVDPGPIDGLWGKRTQAALKKFQEKRGLTVTGKLDEATKVALGVGPEKVTPDMTINRSITLRSQPKALTKEEIVTMIRKNGFHHPADYSGIGLSGSINGTFRHQYEARTFYGEKIVLDHITGLIWQQSPAAFVARDDIQAHINTMNAGRYAGFADWRLPTIEELASLLEYSKKGMDFLNPVFEMPYWYCLSADHAQGDENTVWVVFFEDGYVIHHDGDDDFYVLLVR